MNEVIAIQPGYCVPAVIEMALQKFGYKSMGQKQIAQKLLQITKQDYASFLAEGLKLKQGDLNTFFRESNIKMEEQYISFHYIFDEFDFVEKCGSELEKNAFIVCGYKYSEIWQNRNKSAQHVSVVMGFDNKESVLIYDPGPEKFGVKKIAVEKLWNAIRVANDGIWCIYAKKRV